MARSGEILTVYAAGVVQGIALVTFPAAAAVFTSPSAYGLSPTQYGAMFLPQAVLAVAASAWGAGRGARLGPQRLGLAGLGANLAAMVLLVASRWAMRDAAVAYGLLLLATACLGAGFGLTVPALNTLAAALFPGRINRAILALNALLGLGTALAPVLVAGFVAYGRWWELPVVVGALLAGLLVAGTFQTWPGAGPVAGGETGPSRTALPVRFWLFAAFALLYGICETMNGNWASLYLSSHFGATAALAAGALALFWGLVTVGRILFASLERVLPARLVFRILPWVVAAAFLVSALAPRHRPGLGLAAFALAGLGCSALLPLVISFAQQELASISASVAGGLIASYQIGYGIAAFGAGPLQSSAGLPLAALLEGSAAIALALAALAPSLSRPPAAPAAT